MRLARTGSRERTVLASRLRQEVLEIISILPGTISEPPLNGQGIWKMRN